MKVCAWFVSALFVVILTLPSANAQLYWDIDGNIEGAGGATPTGTWNFTTQNWNLSADGDGLSANWEDDDIAIFSAGTDATGAFDVLLDGSKSTSGITFEEGSVTIIGGVGLTIIGNVEVAETATGTINSVIADSLLGDPSEITKIGLGTLTLGGANTYTGPTTVSAGILQVTNDAGLGTIDDNTTVQSGATLQFAGGLSIAEVLTISGNGSTGSDGALVKSDTSNTTLTGGVTILSGSRVNVEGGTLAINTTGIVGTGGFTKTGAGTLSLSAAGAYTGLTTVASGVISVTNGTALGSSTTGNGTTVESGAALQVSTDLLSIAEPITLNGTGISNAGALRKTGAGTVTKSGATVIASDGARINSDAGTLSITSGVSGSGGTRNIQFGGSGSITVSGTLASSIGTVFKDGSGTLTLAANNSFAGGIVATGGVVSHQGFGGGTFDTTGIVPATFDPDYIQLSNNAILRETRVGSGATHLHPNKGITLGVGGGRLEVTDSTETNVHVYSGVITGSSGGAFTKGGVGTLALTEVQTYDGPTNIVRGILRLRTAIGPSGWLPNTSAVTVTNANAADPGVLDLANFNETVGSIAGNGNIVANASAGTFNVGGNNSSTTYSGSITNTTGGATSLALTKTGTGTMTLSGNNLYTGTTTISNGAIAVASNTALGSTAGTTTVANAGALLIDGSGLVIDEAIQIGNNAAGGIQNLANDNTLNGVISLSAGGRIQSVGGTLTLTGNIKSNNTSARNLTIGGAGNTVMQGVIGHATDPIQNVTKADAGTLTISAANIYTGSTSISGGTLLLGAADVIPDGSAVSVTGTLDMNEFDETIGSLAGAGGVIMSGNLTTGGNNGSTSHSGVISGTGGLTKVGTGIQTIAGNNTYEGGTTVLAGTLRVNNTGGSGAGSGPVAVNGGTLGGTGSVSGDVTVASGGILAPGAGAGTLTVGDLTLDSGSILNFEIDTIAASDKAIIQNDLTINGGTLNVTTLGGFGAGTYVLLDYGTFAGTLSNLTLATAPPTGFSWNLNDSSGSIDLVVTSDAAPILTGDYNDNGTVDAADYVLWRHHNPSATANVLQNDSTPDSVSDADYDAWVANFGSVESPGSGAGLDSGNTAVPEPSSIALLLVGLAALAARRRGH